MVVRCHSCLTLGALIAVCAGAGALLACSSEGSGEVPADASNSGAASGPGDPWGADGSGVASTADDEVGGNVSTGVGSMGGEPTHSAEVDGTTAATSDDASDHDAPVADVGVGADGPDDASADGESDQVNNPGQGGSADDHAADDDATDDTAQTDAPNDSNQGASGEEMDAPTDDATDSPDVPSNDDSTDGDSADDDASPNIEPPANPTGAPLAFPGAEGFGRYTTGGRGGEVVHVTNLDDSGPGSFRDAVSQPNRIVVFDVGGVINISTRIVINRNVTVAGQTAPGGGITIYGNGIAFNGDSGNNIIRYIRVRMGRNGDSKKDAVAISEGQDYMFDNVSISWGRDGTLDVNGSGIDNLTFQDTIIAQGINSDNHSTGGLMQSGKWSVIRSLYIDNKTRNPKARGTHEFINSVLYNWASDGYIMGDTSGVSECNLVGNYFIYGPSSSSDSHITNTTPTFYVYGDDNWVDSNKNGTLDGSVMTDYKTATLVDSPFDHPAGVANKLSGPDALSYVLANAGASIVRDAVDEYLVAQVLSYGTEGQIINTEADNGIPGNVGSVDSGTPPTDTDRDGMPDDWELSRGLDPNTPDDSGDDDDDDGYTNIEEYLSCLVGEGDC